MKKNKSLLPQFHLIDFLFFGLFVGVLLLIFLFLRRENEFITIKVKVTDQNPLYLNQSPFNEYVTGFVIGDVERSEFGQELAQIENVYTYTTTPTSQVVYLTIKLKANYNPLKKTYSSKGRPIAFGESIPFIFSNVKFDGLVVDFPGFERKEEDSKILVKAQLRVESREFSDVVGVPDFIANGVKKGDLVKDSTGEVLAKVIEVEIQPAKRTIVSGNQSVVINDSQLKDVYYILELASKKIGNKEYVLDYIPAEIGAKIPLNFSQITVIPIITELNPLE